MKRKPCGRLVRVGICDLGCEYERMKGKQRCVWHWLLDQPAHIQKQHANARHVATQRAAGDFVGGYRPRARVPASEWPEGERWCAGCQSFVPLFYCSGSRCKSCASEASHASRVESNYGISAEEYAALFAWQHGRCYICGREPRTKRLAVDHDHQTGEVRGLLCAHNENGCNRAVVANLEGSVYGGVAAARRALAYLEDPPYARLLRHRESAGMTPGWQERAAARAAEALQALSDDPAPF